MFKFKKTILAAAMISIVPAAQAQLEEVLVTATKRTASVQDLPFSVNAQTEADIQRSNATTLEELSRNVAGLSIQNLGPGQSQVAIRGVSAGQIVRDQPGVKEQVGVYLDETVISLSLFTPDLDLFDLDRVETLRGPQGTLFGSGSIGGTVRFITKQPVLEEMEGQIEANVNTVDDGSEGGHLKGAINIPMGETLALRLVGYGTQYPGYIDALGEGGRVDEDVNDGSRNGLRAALLWQPTDNFSITPRIVYQELETDGYNRQETYNMFANPFTTTRPAIQLDDLEQYLLLDEAFDDETTIADVVATWSLNAVDLTYVGSYTDRDIVVSRDASALTGSITIDFGFGEDAAQLPSNLRDTTELEQMTHEFRVSSNGDSALQWVAGVFYSDTQRDYGQFLPTAGYDDAIDAVNGPGSADDTYVNGFGPNSPFNSELSYDIEQTAVFGEATYSFTDRLDVTLGGRWYDFEETRDIIQDGIFSSYADQTDETSSDGFTPRILAAYDVTDAVTVNAQASQGFRLGGVNDPLNTPLCSDSDRRIFGGFQDYDDETLWNYEIGVKSMWDNIRLNAAVFYTDIEDLQVTLDAGTCSSRVSFNVEEAHTMGAELELTAYVTDAFVVTFAGSVLEAEFDSTVRDGDGNVVGGVEDGNRLASVPEWQFSVSGTYNFGSILGSEDSYVSLWWQAVGDRITQPSDQLPGAGTFQAGRPFAGMTGDEVYTVETELDSYDLVNLSAGLNYASWDLVVYVNNLTDELALLSLDRERGGTARAGHRVNQPRTYGLTARYNF
ncbi:TonB-dependent receptor [Pseudohalioglobus sediminis]|uniref:TonB-dependent receptor n=1 Tax=Pseudohalioglobus sediminis TaxID=2606449 RepID=A0A5B0X7D0_9GAMM|nr:TonB-dependent receptor [Pseudohalioglobus sediminis]KAA1194139.1 TonB-dependent receptor [Pseudohalioglobus sediminis]